MTKAAVADWDTVPANNTDVGGVNIAEGSAARSTNDAKREIMAQVKTKFDTADAAAAAAQTANDAALATATNFTPSGRYAATKVNAALTEGTDFYLDRFDTIAAAQNDAVAVKVPDGRPVYIRDTGANYIVRGADDPLNPEGSRIEPEGDALPEKWGAPKTAGQDDAPAVQAALDFAAAKGRNVLLTGAYFFRTGVTVPSGVDIECSGASILVEAQIPTVIHSATTASAVFDFTGAIGSTIQPLAIDANGFASHIFYGQNCTGITVDMGKETLKGWRFGAQFISDEAARVQHVNILGGRWTNPIMPVHAVNFRTQNRAFIGTDQCTDITIEGVYAEGVGNGAYTPNGAYTADMIALQGVVDFKINKCTAKQSGENGFAVSRCCRFGELKNCNGTLSDGHGLQLGAGQTVLTIQGMPTISDGDIITSDDVITVAAGGEVTGEVDGVVSAGAFQTVYLEKVSGADPFQVDSTVNGGAGTITARILAAEWIEVDGGKYMNNGVDAGNSAVGFSGIFINQCDQIRIRKSLVADTMGTQTYGVQANSTENLLCDAVGKGVTSAFQFSDLTSLRAGWVYDDDDGRMTAGPRDTNPATSSNQGDKFLMMRWHTTPGLYAAGTGATLRLNQTNAADGRAVAEFSRQGTKVGEITTEATYASFEGSVKGLPTVQPAGSRELWDDGTNIPKLTP